LGEISHGVLDRTSGALGLGFQFRLGLAHPESRRLARLVYRRVSIRAPLLNALLAHLEDLGARLAQFVGVLVRPRFGLRNRPVGILDRASVRARLSSSVRVNGFCTRNW